MTTYTVKHFCQVCFALFILLMPAQKLFAQMEFKPWGNIDGIRVKGQLMDFNTCVVVVWKDWKKISFTGKELQKPRYKRQEKEEAVNTEMGDLQFTISAKDEGSGKASLTIQCIPQKDVTVTGVYLNLSLPKNIYGRSPIKIDNGNEQSLDDSHSKDSVYFQSAARKFSFASAGQQIKFQADTLSPITLTLE